MASFVESFVFHETEYEFTCPLCGHKWTKKEISQDSLKSFIEAYATASGDNRSKFVLLESLKVSISNKVSNESCIDFLSEVNNKLYKNAKTVYNKHLAGHNLKSFKNGLEEKEKFSKGRNLFRKILGNNNSSKND